MSRIASNVDSVVENIEQEIEQNANVCNITKVLILNLQRMHDKKDRLYSKCMRRSCKQGCHKLLLRPTQNSVRFMRLRGARFHTDSQLNLQLIHPHHLNP